MTNVLTILLSAMDPKFQKISTVNVLTIPKYPMNVHVCPVSLSKVTSVLTSTDAQLVAMFVNHLLSVSTNTQNSQEPQVLSSHVNRSMNAKSVLTDALSMLTASTQHTITPMVATWIPMLTVHQIMTANVTPVTQLIQMVPTPTHVIKDASVLISMNALLESITVTNMPNATIMRAHPHAHVKRDGLD